MNENLIGEIRQTLIDSSDKKTLESSKRYFKKGEEALVYGVNTAVVRTIGKSYYNKIQHLDKNDIFDICEALWKSGYLEEAVVACMFSEYLHKQYMPSDFLVFEHWVKHYVKNWADCDTLCNHTIGSFIMMYPEYVNMLKVWAKSPQRWVKRAAAVSLIIPARRGLFLDEIFKIADLLLSDKDDLVQKGFGWMLKAASEAHQVEVFNYVLSNKAVMPRTALRYAIEKMPEKLKAEAMMK